MSVRILIAGEGPNEIGSKTDPGAIEALLERLQPGLEIRHRVLWKDVRKYHVRSGGSSTLNAILVHGDAVTVARLAERAVSLGCNLVVFLRDRDGDTRREAAIRAVLSNNFARLRKTIVVGGVPIEQLEAWILALHGHEGTENLQDPVSLLHKHLGVEPKSTAQLVDRIRKGRLQDVPADARSLLDWLRRAAISLGASAP